MHKKGSGTKKRKRERVEDSPLAADSLPLEVDSQETRIEEELEVKDTEVDGDGTETSNHSIGTTECDHLSTSRLSTTKATEKQVTEEDPNEKIDACIDKSPLKITSLRISTSEADAKCERSDLKLGLHGENETFIDVTSSISMAKSDTSSQSDMKTCDSHKQLDDMKSIEERVVPHPSTVTIEANSRGNNSNTLTIRKKKRSPKEFSSTSTCGGGGGGAAAAATTPSQVTSGSTLHLPTNILNIHSTTPRVRPVSQVYIYIYIYIRIYVPLLRALYFHHNISKLPNIFSL